MKKILNIFLLALSFTLITACDSGFDDMNTSKSGATSLDPVFILNNAIISSSPTTSQIYEMASVQQWFSSNTGVLEGGNFNKIVVNNTPANWQNYYRNVIKYTNDVISRIGSDPALANRTNLLHMARIIQANAFLILTDTYGDIPYSEAGGGYSDQAFFPTYETQQTIYPKIIDELSQATAALDPAARIETGDVLYAGNIAKWKRFGYSLLLRAGMRLSKADPTKAAATVAAANAGGVILTIADNAIIRHDANFINGYGNTVNGGEAANYYLAEPFVNALKTRNDPRLSSIAIRYGGARNGGDQTANSFGNGSTAAANQFGVPIGSTDGAADISGALLPAGGSYGSPAAPRTGTRFCYSQVDRNRIVKRTSPMFLVTAGQSNLLLAEARVRGYITTGTASGYFQAGIRAHMDQMVSYDPGCAVSGTNRDNYIASAAGTLDESTTAASIAQIGYEYWVASFLHGPEAWANFRRTGAPALTPNPFSGSETPGGFINRLPYPNSEVLVNGSNVAAAIAGLGGPDDLNTKVWWNK